MLAPRRSSALVIAPHPDDETIGCGGSISLDAENGTDVYVLVIIRREVNAMLDSDQEDEFERACRALNVSALQPLDCSSRTGLDRRKALVGMVRALRTVRPQVVYIPHADESDQEHKAVHLIAREALWMASGMELASEGPPCDPPEIVLGYEVWTPIAHPAMVRDVSPVLDRKLKALAEYQSQNPKALQRAVSGLAAYRGHMFGSTPAAEAFEVVRLSDHVFGLFVE